VRTHHYYFVTVASYLNGRRWNPQGQEFAKGLGKIIKKGIFIRRISLDVLAKFLIPNHGHAVGNIIRFPVVASSN
jgi:hypothetical protein